MNVYEVRIERRVLKNLAKLDVAIHEQLLKEIAGLADNPRPVGCKRLKGRRGYRVRVGDYRIIYEINDGELLVLVITVAHRKDVYRK